MYIKRNNIWNSEENLMVIEGIICSFFFKFVGDWVMQVINCNFAFVLSVCTLWKSYLCTATFSNYISSSSHQNWALSTKYLVRVSLLKHALWNLFRYPRVLVFTLVDEFDMNCETWIIETYNALYFSIYHLVTAVCKYFSF